MVSSGTALSHKTLGIRCQLDSLSQSPHENFTECWGEMLFVEGRSGGPGRHEGGGEPVCPEEGCTKEGWSVCNLQQQWGSSVHRLCQEHLGGCQGETPLIFCCSLAPSSPSGKEGNPVADSKYADPTKRSGRSICQQSISIMPTLCTSDKAFGIQIAMCAKICQLIHPRRTHPYC